MYDKKYHRKHYIKKVYSYKTQAEIQNIPAYFKNNILQNKQVLSSTWLTNYVDSITLYNVYICKYVPNV